MNILLIYIGFFILLFIIIFIIQSIKIRNLSTKLRNKVRFFVEREVPKNYFLFIRHKDGMWYICSDYHFKLFGLNPDDFADMKEGEIREVFINLED